MKTVLIRGSNTARRLISGTWTRFWTGKTRLQTILISAAIGTAFGFLVDLLWVHHRGEWKPSGDRKTIYNTATGELRYTASGRSVAEVNAETAANYEANKERYKREQEERDKKAESERLAREQKAESDRQVREQKAEFERQKAKAIRAQNSPIYAKVKKFVDDHPRIVLGYNPQQAGVYSNSEWIKVTRPFRTGMFLTRSEQLELLDFLGRAANDDNFKSDPSFADTIAELKKWHYGNNE